MSATAPMRMGIIGTGNIGAAYAQAIDSSDVVTLTAVCDLDADRAKNVAGTDAVVFDSYEELAASGLCDAVIVSTPPVTHESVAIACLKSGLDVLCEKPFTLGEESALRMCNAASTEGRILAMASKFRYVPDIALARELIRSGAIGDPTVVDVTFASPVDMTERWNSVVEISGGGVLIDNGTHAVDVVRYLVGPIKRVSAMRGRTFGIDDVEDTAMILAETGCQTIANIQVSWAVAAHNESYVVVRGKGGTIRIGWAESKYRQGDGGWKSFGTGYSKMEALRANAEDFARCVQQREPMRISTDDVLASVSVIEGAYRAISTGQWIEIESNSVSASMGKVAASSMV